MNKICISFKNNEVENKIHQYLINKLSYSIYIKELVLEDMNRREREEREYLKANQNTLSEEEDNDDMGFSI